MDTMDAFSTLSRMMWLIFAVRLSHFWKWWKSFLNSLLFLVRISALPFARKQRLARTSTKLISMDGRSLMFARDWGEAISAKMMVCSSSTTMVPFGETLGVPSGLTEPTIPTECCSAIVFMRLFMTMMKPPENFLRMGRL